MPALINGKMHVNNKCIVHCQSCQLVSVMEADVSSAFSMASTEQGYFALTDTLVVQRTC